MRGEDEERRWRYVKAVDGSGEIVGFAGWGVSVGKVEGKEGKEEGGEKEGSGWGVGANAKLCEDVFLPADAAMLGIVGGASIPHASEPPSLLITKFLSTTNQSRTLHPSSPPLIPTPRYR